jgi:hypothetical protein
MSELGSRGEPVGEPVVERPASGRRLSGRETALWYGVAGLSYVGVSIFHKFLLNWFVGPLWLVVVVWLGPLLVDRVRGRGRRRPGAVE